MNNDNEYICPECGEEGHDQDCPECEGFGEIEIEDDEWQACEDCQGEGVVNFKECPGCGNIWEHIW